jgi:beta-glucosidase
VSYRYFTLPPVLPFGFGLSYTRFAYSGLRVAATAAPCDDIQVIFSVQNIGSVDSDEVVQVYVRTPNASVPAPRVRLVAFQRVHLRAGAPPTAISLTIKPAFRSVVLDNARDNFWQPTRLVEAGIIDVSVGGGQPDFYEGALTTHVQITSSANLDHCSA